jgi:hypothetical protein
MQKSSKALIALIAVAVACLGIYELYVRTPLGERHGTGLLPDLFVQAVDMSGNPISASIIIYDIGRNIVCQQSIGSTGFEHINTILLGSGTTYIIHATTADGKLAEKTVTLNGGANFVTLTLT